MSYQNAEMPPVVRLVDETNGTIDWQLEGQSGVVVQTYTTDSINHPNDWWDDMRDALINNSTQVEAALDMMRLNALRDWEVVDDR